jgi:hypothetical protein
MIDCLINECMFNDKFMIEWLIDWLFDDWMIDCLMIEWLIV